MEYYGCGLGASGFVNGNRYKNTKSLQEYNSHNYVKESEKVSNVDNIEYYLLTNLRMEKGFSKIEFKQKFGKDFEEMFGEKIAKANIRNLISIDEKSIKLTDEGLMLMDYVLFKLI